uniref:Uncharacterized protein OSJNBa0049O12.11 n=1 Tax=Oryza sativa TaxID=4530 RepID=Q948G3_ORYSA|nr:Hypothetical protein [Oryza sativa Japonica Group]
MATACQLVPAGRRDAGQWHVGFMRRRQGGVLNTVISGLKIPS